MGPRKTEENKATGDTITFLGTAGARFMVSKQLAASGGMWFDLNGTRLLIDPGPGCIVQTNKRKLNPENLSAIIVSHRHLDHSADVNVMVEAMTTGGFKKRGRLFMPADALAPEPVIFSYLKNYIEGITVLEAEKTYQVGSLSFRTSVRHLHPVETYGMVFAAAGKNVGYLTDTRYFGGLAPSYAGSDLLIINMVFMEPRPPIDHLSVPDVAQLIKEIKPKTAILNHFGMHVWKARPWLVAEDLAQKTGFRVIAARDGMKFSLAQLDNPEGAK
ncbi:MAG: MBL fold hydrolase [Chloroflexi bacterium RBG_13_57_8]|nr:MAG: MBL fold hydrolase [Chloroflexi bacterium RBG_13_57_8]